MTVGSRKGGWSLCTPGGDNSKHCSDEEGVALFFSAWRADSGLSGRGADWDTGWAGRVAKGSCPKVPLGGRMTLDACRDSCRLAVVEGRANDTCPGGGHCK